MIVFGLNACIFQRFYAIDSFPALTNSIPRSTDIDAYDHLRGLPLPDVGQDRVKIIIGQDNSAALMPLELRTGERGNLLP